MARSYTRDSNGRFSGGGGGRSGGSSGSGGGGGKKKAANPGPGPMKKPPLPPPPLKKPPLPPPPKAATKKGANAIQPSPRRLNAAEKAYLEIKAQKGKFGSDKKVIAEMTRRGFLKGADPQGQAIRIASNARRKKGSPY